MSSTIWLVDRSRIADGRGFCQRSRYLNSHSGPHGYGMQLKGTKLPLMTGTGAHEGLRPILEYCRDNFQSDPALTGETHTVPALVVKGAIQVAQQQYYDIVERRGFAYMADQAGVKELVREQNFLIAGLIWAWVLEVLPEVLRRGRVVEVEQDDTYVLGCTCGLGDGVMDKATHESRDCEGIGLMCKPDFLLQTWATEELEYHEFKTTGQDGPSFRDKWETMIQLFAATLDAERRYGKHVQTIYIHGLFKGKRGQEYNEETGKYDSGPDRQNSIFCYGYRKPAVPPMEKEEWAATYKWTEVNEQTGEVKGRRLGKAYQKAGVWELPEAVIPPEMDTAEFWAKWIPAEARRKALVILGPFSRQQIMVPHFVQECVGEETRWQAGLWELHDLAQVILEEQQAQLSVEDDGRDWWNLVWPDPRFQSLLDRLFPRSYECRRYGQRMRCQFEDVCFEREGWADPMGTGRFIIRRPHHRDELEQMASRGLLPPEDGVAETGEE